jgi:hypothetical protein
MDCVVEKSPFRVRTIPNDRGHGLQALSHWHLVDLGMEHVHITPRTPHDQRMGRPISENRRDESYQSLSYRYDADPEKKWTV